MADVLSILFLYFPTLLPSFFFIEVPIFVGRSGMGVLGEPLHACTCFPVGIGWFYYSSIQSGALILPLLKQNARRLARNNVMSSKDRYTM
jgi:hypothetical protein